MGMFSKKSDPISDRARDLNDQIARLEEQIADLAQQTDSPIDYSFESDSKTEAQATSESLANQATSSQPETLDQSALSTATAERNSPPPRKVSVTRTPTPATQEEVPSPRSKASVSTPAIKEPRIAGEPGKNPFRSTTPSTTPVPDTQPPSSSSRELGVRKSDVMTALRRFTNSFRGRGTSNPKLVNYLAAGSIQGLRPLRYEKRVARNRFLLLLTCLVFALWGIIALIMNR